MKRPRPLVYVTLFLILIHLNGFSQPTKKLVWYTNYNQVTQLASRDEKPALLFFHVSDSCSPCLRMQKEVFDNKQFIQFASERILFLDIDFPVKNKLTDAQLKHNNKLKKQFNLSAESTEGYPLMVIIDKTGKVLYEEKGYDSEGPQKLMDKIRLAVKIKNK